MIDSRGLVAGRMMSTSRGKQEGGVRRRIGQMGQLGQRTVVQMDDLADLAHFPGSAP